MRRAALREVEAVIVQNLHKSANLIADKVEGLLVIVAELAVTIKCRLQYLLLWLQLLQFYEGLN
jgi:hypothetical protein